MRDETSEWVKDVEPRNVLGEGILGELTFEGFTVSGTLTVRYD